MSTLPTSRDLTNGLTYRVRGALVGSYGLDRNLEVRILRRGIQRCLDIPR